MGDVLDAPVELLQIPSIPSTVSEADLPAAIEAQRDAVVDVARAFGADAVYERYSLFGGAGVAAAAALGIPHVLEVNAPLRAEAARLQDAPSSGLAAESSAPSFAAPTGSCPSRRRSDGGSRTRVSSPSGSTVVPNAVAPARIGGRHSRGDDDLVLGFCGSLKPWHGIEVLLEACAIAFAQEPAMRLEVIGSGPLEHLLDFADLPPERVRAFGAAPSRRRARAPALTGTSGSRRTSRSRTSTSRRSRSSSTWRSASARSRRISVTCRRSSTTAVAGLLVPAGDAERLAVGVRRSRARPRPRRRARRPRP